MKKNIYLNNTVKQILQNSQLIAKKENAKKIGVKHLFFSILYTGNNKAAHLLNNHGIYISDDIKKLFKQKDKLNKDKLLMNFNNEVINILLLADKFRISFKQKSIDSLMILLAIFSIKNEVLKLLYNKNINIKEIYKELNEIIKNTTLKNKEEISSSNNKPNENDDYNNIIFFPMSNLHSFLERINNIHTNENHSKKDISNTPYLDHFTKDITADAAKNKLMPIIGREKEIERIIHILNRKTKNNPVLIGDAGVGKTAIVEGLAQLIVQKKVPQKLQNKRILMLDITAVIAGTMYRGDFEKRIMGILNEAKNKENNVILFIDEIHMLMGAGDVNGSIDAANILKPALARNEIQIIGATTYDEYSKHIEKDPAFERRLQPIIVKEPSEEDTYNILKGIKTQFENFHHINIPDELLKDIIYLAKRYINDKFFPDKAIDLMDEACAIKSSYFEHNNNNKILYAKIKEIKEKITQIRNEIGKSIAIYDYETAAKLRKNEVNLLKELEKLKDEVEKMTLNNTPQTYETTLTKEDILKVISHITNIPINELFKNDFTKYTQLAENLSKEIKGQKNAIEKITNAIKRVASGLDKPNRPLGSFLLLGPSGVGKTLLVKKLAKYLFGSEDKMIRLDMSEYMDSISSTKLIGAPAGYVGYEEGGWLINQVRKNPYSIILVDEIEKAHKDIFNIFLQILDEGHLTSNKGKKANFKNTIIIMTSNIGTEQLTSKGGPIGFLHDENEENKKLKEYEIAKEQAINQLKKRLPPEFLNRIDEIIIFDPLKHEDILEIVKMQINELSEKLAQKGYNLKINPKVYTYLADKGYSIEYGARNIHRTIQTELENKIADIILTKDKSFKDIEVNLSKNSIIIKTS